MAPRYQKPGNSVRSDCASYFREVLLACGRGLRSLISKLLQLKSGFISRVSSPLVSEAASRLECLPSDRSSSAFYNPKLIKTAAEGGEGRKRERKKVSEVIKSLRMDEVGGNVCVFFFFLTSHAFFCDSSVARLSERSRKEKRTKKKTKTQKSRRESGSSGRDFSHQRQSEQSEWSRTGSA